MASIAQRYLQSPLWLAPMAGVTDKAFRTLCIEHGAALTYSEMISAGGTAFLIAWCASSGDRKLLDLTPYLKSKDIISMV